MPNPPGPLGHFFEENRCDLLVLATHAREGLARLLHGSIAEALARQVDGPSLLLPLGSRGFVDAATGTPRLKSILVPVDPATSPEAAVSLTLMMADALGCEDALAYTLHVGSPEGAPVVAVDARHEPRLRRLTGEGEVVPAILDAATRVDANLIVMATRGHDGLLDALRGSTTERVLHHAGRAVLAVPVT